MKHTRLVRGYLPRTAAIAFCRPDEFALLNNGFPVIVALYDAPEMIFVKESRPVEWAVNRMRDWAVNHGLKVLEK